LLAAFGLLSFQPSATQATIVVNEWLLGTGLSDPGNSQYPSASFSNVQNPFQGSHTATLDNSYATTSYDMGWTVDSAHFDAFPTHHLEQLDGDAGSEGRIRLTPSIDSTISLHGTYEYAWPSAAEGTSVIFMSVTDLQTEEEIVGDSAFGGNFGIGPYHGTLDVSGNATLLAGREYFLYYIARIILDPTPPGTYGEGVGEIHFAITPVPEPATALLLACFLLIAFQRRRC